MQRQPAGVDVLLVFVVVGGGLSACAIDAMGVLSPDAAITSNDATIADVAVTRSDANTPDGRTTDARRTDARRTDAHRADARMTDARASDASMTDARVAEDAHMTDAKGTDATREDAGVHDAGKDAPAPTTFCTTVSPAPTFCADFDEPDASVAAGWSSVSSASTSLTLSTTTYDSPPRALAAASETGGTGSVMTTFSTVNSISVDFDVLYTTIPSSGDISPIRLAGPGSGEEIYFYASTTLSYFQESGNDYSMPPDQAAPSLNTWHQVSIAITTSGGASKINASVDGTAYWTNHSLAQAWPMSAAATLEIGLAEAYEVTAPAALYIDNVVVRVNQ